MFSRRPKVVGKYVLTALLGEGSFGVVREAVHTITGESVAVKVIEKAFLQAGHMGSQIRTEIAIMKCVSHPNVVKLHEVVSSKERIYIILELVRGGDLFDRIVAATRFDEDTARRYFREITAGVSYCHARGVFHRDLKPENLLIDSSGSLKISDFGLSKLFNPTDGSDSLLHTACGTPNYVAPEVLSGRGYDGRTADVWSMGVVLWVMHSGSLPFNEPQVNQLFMKIQRADFVFPDFFSPEIRAFLSAILVVDPVERITVEEMIAHPFFRGPDNFVLAAPSLAAAASDIARSTSTESAVGELAAAPTDEELPQRPPSALSALEAVALCGTADFFRRLDCLRARE